MKRFSSLRASRGVATWSMVCTYTKWPRLWAFTVLSAPLLSFLIAVIGHHFSLVLFPILSLTFNTILLGKARILWQSMRNLPLGGIFTHFCIAAYFPRGWDWQFLGGSDGQLHVKHRSCVHTISDVRFKCWMFNIPPHTLTMIVLFLESYIYYQVIMKCYVWQLLNSLSRLNYHIPSVRAHLNKHFNVSEVEISLRIDRRF